MSEKLTFEKYKDDDNEFRWRLKASNGKTIADSGEGYKDRRDLDHAIELIKAGASGAQTKESE